MILCSARGVKLILCSQCILWEDHSLKPSSCPHATEMGALREAACDNTEILVDLTFCGSVTGESKNMIG